jgi:ABC-type sulfate/molybdate transport systems ATPase subunit
MSQGTIVAAGTPESVYRKPGSRFTSPTVRVSIPESAASILREPVPVQPA